ncbi:MAG: alpha/beta hydrolase family protein [Rhodocyclales bacterium]|nr:alpha/beta hydrolase family protein [Rhodocyclales bacterium]
MRRIKLVLLPGLDGTGVLFKPLLQALAPSIEAVVIAYPDRQPLGYDALLPLVMQGLPQREPYVLLGESFGGPLALRIAASRPEGLQALVLSASFISCPHHFVPTWAAHLVRPFPFRAFPRYAQIKALFGGYVTPALAALSAQALGQVAAEVFACRVKEVVRVNVSSALAACAVPMLYIQGSRDRVVPRANLQRILAIKPSVEHVSIEAPHMILQTQPEAAANAIEAFLQAHAIA